MKFPRFKYKKINSTNDVAIKKIKEGYLNGIITSDSQIKARGQYGKKWICYKGNLFMSIFFKVKIKIKYPNDLLINNRKFCGILQETILNENGKFIIIGIGLNLVKSPNIKNYLTTNILEETGLNLDKNKLSKLIEANYYKKFNLFA